MNPAIRIPLIIVGILFIISLIALPYFFYKNKAESLSYQFSGRVDTVYYDAKDEPTVKISGNKYVLPAKFWHFNRQIQVGDFLIKQKGFMTIRMVKKDGTVIIKQ